MGYYADVILPINVNQLLTYRIQDSIFDLCQIGTRVAVPLGKKKLYTGVIVNIHQNKPLHYEVKDLKEVLDSYPILHTNQLKLFKWIKSYYLSSYSQILKACLPNALLIQSETIIELNNDIVLEKNDLSDSEFIIVEAIEKHGFLKIQDAQQILGKASALKIIQSLMEKNNILIDRKVIHKYKPKIATYIRINDTYQEADKLKVLLHEMSNTPKQKEVILTYFNLLSKSKKPITKKSIQKVTKVSDSVIKRLIDKNIFQNYSLVEDRIAFSLNKSGMINSLSEDQNKAFQKIKDYFKQEDIVLFKGITSSGKTEIYFKIIEELLAKEAQVLYLLPEIALTTQIIKRIQQIFGEKVIVYHSKYTNNERVEIYNKVLHNTKAQVIVGTRSAIFLPFKQLQLIIVDESHENSYKQYDPSPRYQARDTALVLGKIHKAKVLLGSATPSIESYYNTTTEKYKYVELTKRYGNVKPPKINIIDLKEKYKRKKMNGHFSDELIDKIKSTIDQGKQVIIFQNRRGFSPVVECHTCGHTPQCPHCDVSLTLHKANNTLRCHYCGYKMSLQKNCLSCGSNNLNTLGFGTEQLEIEAQKLLPSSIVKRMDFDTTRGKNSFENIILAFENQEIDILVGTQMLSKGLDFKNVDLVAVMQADTLLHYPNFRAYEKCYQLLTQVAGRAGRSKKQGEVIIQTFQPKHSIINNVLHEDYTTFYKTEIQQREQYNYPPFYKLIKLTFKSKNYNLLNESSEWMAKYLKQIFKENILGPEFPSIARIRNQYIKNIIIKIPPKQSVHKSKKYLSKAISVFENISTYKSVRLNIDVDPYT